MANVPFFSPSVQRGIFTRLGAVMARPEAPKPPTCIDPLTTQELMRALYGVQERLAQLNQRLERLAEAVQYLIALQEAETSDVQELN